MLAKYLGMIYPFYSEGVDGSDFLIKLLEAALQDEYSDVVRALDFSRDYAGRVFNGKRSFPVKTAAEVTSHLDEKKIKNFFRNRTTDAAVRVLQPKLQREFQKTCRATIPAVSIACAELFLDILVAISTNQFLETEKSASESISETLHTIDTLIVSLPKPSVQDPPEIPREDEKEYIAELYRAFSDHEDNVFITEEVIDDYPNYNDDLKQSRIDYFSAEAVNRCLRELKSDQLSGQFDVLKDEMLSGVRGTCRKRYIDGYEKMLTVLDRALDVPLSQYILSNSPYWISNHIRKGVCHYLVNDHKIRWVEQHD